MGGFHPPFRYDRDRHEEGILLYVRNGIPAKELKEYQLPDDNKCSFVEMNIKKRNSFLHLYTGLLLKEKDNFSKNKGNH